MVPRSEEQHPAGLPALADAVSDGLVVCRDGRIVAANRRLAELVGAERPEDLVGRGVESLLAEPAEGLPERPGPAAVRRLAGGEGRVASVRRVCGAAGGAEALYAFEDRSEALRLEAELEAARRALQDAQREIAFQAERARQEAAEREELLTLVSHELRTPVTVITGYNRLLLAGKVGELDDRQRRFLRESQKSCERLNDFIANLLELSRERRGDLHVQPAPGSLAASVREVAGFLRPLVEEAGLRIRVEVEPEAARAWFDPLRIEQVLTNLIGNAIKYAATGGRIEVSARRLPPPRDGWLEIAVSDDGPGVAPADRERIFEPYVRAGREKSAGGLGLGLSICKHIVEAHGGSIGVGDRPGGGSRFAFTLPLEDPRKEEGR